MAVGVRNSLQETRSVALRRLDGAAAELDVEDDGSWVERRGDVFVVVFVVVCVVV